MERAQSKRRVSPPGAVMTGTLAALLLICLADCATGSCLSYGHSCWGGHGKRSYPPSAVAPDWFVNKLLRREDSVNNEMQRTRQAPKHNDITAIYQGDTAIDSPPNNRLGSDTEDYPVEVMVNRNPEARPMLDDELLTKIKLWQIMREATVE